MSRTLEKLRRQGRQFHLRLPDGSFQGPFEAEDLTQLAIHNRVPPGSEVSDDGATWMPAECLAELKLEWIAAMPDGRQYGPFHLLALPALINEGNVTPDATLSNRVSGRSMPVGEVLRLSTKDGSGESDAKKGGTASAAPPAEEAYEVKTVYRRQSDEAPQPAGELNASRVHNLQRAMESAAVRFKEISDRLEGERSAHSRAISEHEKQEKALKEKIARLEEDLRANAVTLAQARADADKQRKWDQSLVETARHKELEFSARADQLQKTAEDASKRLRDMTAKLQEEASLRGQLAEENRRKEIRQSDRIAMLEEDMKAAEHLLAQTRLDADQQKKRDQSLLDMSRQKEAELNQRLDELLRTSDGKASELGKLKVELDREKTLHAESRKLLGERERQLVSRTGDLEEKARVSMARLKEAQQIADASKEKLDSLQQEARNRETLLAQRTDELEKSTESAARRIKELALRLDEEQNSHAKTVKDAKRKEQEISERLVKAQHEAGSAANLLAQVRSELEEQKKQNAALAEQNKSREARLNQRAEQLQAENSRNLALLEQARNKLSEDKSARSAAEAQEREKERVLSETLRQAEKRAEDNAKAAERLKAQAEAAELKLREVETERNRTVELLEQSRSRSAQSEKARAAAETREREREEELTSALERAVKRAEDAARATEQSKSRAELLAGRVEQLEKEHNHALSLLKESGGKERKDESHRAQAAANEREKELSAAFRQAEQRIDEATGVAERCRAEADELSRRNTELEKERDRARALVENAAKRAESDAAEAMKKEYEEKLAAAAKEAEKRIGEYERGVEKLRAKIAEETEARLAALAVETDRLRSRNSALEESLRTLKREAAAPGGIATGVPVSTVAATAVPGRGFAVKPSSAIAAALALILAGVAIGRLAAPSRGPPPTEPLAAPVVEPAPPAPSVAEPVSVRPEVGPVVEAIVEPGPIALELPPPPKTPAPDRTPPPVHASAAWPEISLAGVKTNATDSELTITFDYGTFSYMTILQDEAKDDLRSVATALRERMKGLVLIVEGVTDSVPLSGGATYSNNFQLGMARAETAARFLTSECDMPAKNVIATSSGDRNPPFSNDDPELRKKNRTVVLRLVRANSEAARSAVRKPE